LNNINKKRVIVCAANRSIKSGKIICGARHWDSIMRQQVVFVVSEGGVKSMPEEWRGAEQGFIDQYGVWITREEAWKIAKAAGQIIWGADRPDGQLFSEDLY